MGRSVFIPSVDPKQWKGLVQHNQIGHGDLERFFRGIRHRLGGGIQPRYFRGSRGRVAGGFKYQRGGGAVGRFMSRLWWVTTPALAVSVPASR